MIFTDHLELRPMTAAFMQALYDRRTADAAALESVRLPDEWDVIGPHDWLRARIMRVLAVPGLAEWSLRSIIRRDDQQVLGNIGFHEPPGMHPSDGERPGVVEFGFTVAPAFRRTGVAREASHALMDWATRVHGVCSFRLSIAPDNAASQGLAVAIGFRHVGEYEHDARGRQLLFERVVVPL
ncbi:MAG: GNAT family N-acetyltransferase [Planctomycetota bacterium]